MALATRVAARILDAGAGAPAGERATVEVGA